MQLANIRKNILKISQAELARICGATQATVSRWEKGELEPGLSEMAAIRDFARANAIDWQDAWFFQTPPAERLAS